MKKILTIVLLLVTSTVFADNTANSTAGSTAGSVAGSTSYNSTTTDLTYSSSSYAPAANLGSMVPNVSAPGLATTLTETCMGSTSGGAAAAGWGFSFGTTWRDSACVRRLDSRQMSAFGDTATARQMMCDSELVRNAAKAVGRPCMEDGGVPFGQVAVAPVMQETPADAPAAAVVTQQVKE